MKLRTKLNVLCLEDNLKDTELFYEMLADDDYQVSMDIAKGEKEFVDFLKNRDYDIILSDNSLPGINALAALNLAIALKPEVPFICVSGTIGEEKAVELLKQGASDYVLKDRLTKLALAVRRALKEKEMQKERHRADEELKNTIDKITITNKELAFQIKEKEKREDELVILNTILKHQISKSNQYDQALKESNEKYLKAFQSSPYSIAITRVEDGKFIEVNDAFTSVFGFTREKVIAKSTIGLNIWVNNEERKWVKSTLLDGKEISGKEFLFRKKNGEIITGLFSARIIYLNNEEPCIISSINDITERKQAELELIKAKDNAEVSDRLKTAFLNNMSHEVRTPMNGILGFTDLLKEPNLSAIDQQDFIQNIQISGARLLSTINNLVDISKIESGLIKVGIEEVNINEKIEFIYKFFTPEIESKGLQFIFKTSLLSTDAIIKTDQEKVNAILTNLVKNAIKFTYDGSIEFGYEKKGEYLEFFVKDTGVGIPKNQKELIFERFRQGNESHSRGYEGSGLGLSIAKSYVGMLGGEIWVESEESQGSIFYFTIPYNALTAGKKEIENAVSAEDKKGEIKKLKILIVEDDEISYSLLTRTLKNISKVVLHGSTGIEAVEACRNNPDLDLVLMDIRMPNMDGNEATRQIRKFNKDVIIIAQTAYAFSGDREKAIDAGCNDYITKPINKTLLYEIISTHINKE